MSITGQFAVLIPAAGSGSRFTASGGGGGAEETDKLLLDLAGQSVLRRSIGIFAGRPEVSAILVVAAAERIRGYQEHLREMVMRPTLHFTTGGRERWESVLLGLRLLVDLPNPAHYVAVHDAARPLTSGILIDEAFRVTIERGAALPCLAEPATLKKRAPDGTVAETIDRRGLFQAQTPQCFELVKLLAAYEKLHKVNQLADVTDDAQVYERMRKIEGGHLVPITSGSPVNLKITTADDLVLARAIAATLP